MLMYSQRMVGVLQLLFVGVRSFFEVGDARATATTPGPVVLDVTVRVETSTAYQDAQLLPV